MLHHALPPAVLSDDPSPLENEAGERANLVLRLARLLLTLGAPVYRLETAMEVIADKLELSGQFFATPTAVVAALGNGTRQQTFLVRAAPGEINLEKLAAAQAVMEDLKADRVSVREASNAIEAIASRAPRFGNPVVVLAFGATSAAAATFFGGGWREVVVAAVLGLLTGALSYALSRHHNLSRLFEPLAATGVAFMAQIAAAFLMPLQPLLVTLAGLIVLLPGLGITLATRELGAGHLVAGSARMAGAVVVLLTIAFGLALGSHLGDLVVTTTQVHASLPLPEWAKYVALPVISAGLLVLFQARLRELGWFMLAGVIAWVGGNMTSTVLGPQLGAASGAFLLGIAGNLFARFSNRPAAIIHFPGLMLLVPGSLGFRSLAALMENDIQAGIHTAFNATMIAVALATGLLLASVLVAPKREF